MGCNVSAKAQFYDGTLVQAAWGILPVLVFLTSEHERVRNDYLFGPGAGGL